jgi:CheY-like chemotaxis protein
MAEKHNNPLILIVDDIPKNLQLLSSILNKESYQISFASNGFQALSVLETTKPDLILLDVMMPEMDGYEVCQKIKANSELSHIPIIFLTGKAEHDDIIRGLQVGAVDYITKPFNSAELLSRVKTHVDLKLSKDKIVTYNKELESVRDELAALNASKDKFFSIVAHDLRSPFSGFLGLTQLLVEEHENLKPNEIQQISGSMFKAAKKLYQFLENLLEWSRTQMGKTELIFESLNLYELIDRIYYLVSEIAADKKLVLTNDIPKDISLYADSQTMNAIVRNLVSNAIKFSNNGGEIKAGISVLNESKLEFYIMDSGVGIPKENMPLLFRLDKKMTTNGTANEQGSGLGLLLVSEFVKMNKGAMRIVSEPEKGTTIFISFDTNNL